MEAELSERLARHVARIESGTLNARQRKRILQKIGALKKRIAAAKGDGTSSQVGAQGNQIHSNAEKNNEKKRKAMNSIDSEPSTTTAPQTRTGDETVAFNKRARKDHRQGASAVPRLLSRAERKKKLIGTNRRLQELARRKQLAKAEACFHRARAKGIVDVHTFSNMINVYVRCGCVEKAQLLFNEMKTRRPPVVPNVVAYTTLLKGVGSEGRFEVVEQLLQEMEHAIPPQTPTLRTLNTLLRSCMRHSRPSFAARLFEKAQTVWGINCDASSYEYLIFLLSNSFQVKEAADMITKLKQAATLRLTSSSLSSSNSAPKARMLTGPNDSIFAGEADASENPVMYVALARAAALTGNQTLARNMLQQSERLLLGNDNFLERRMQHKKDSHENSSRNLARIKSMREFAKHRVDDARREVALLRSFLSQRINIDLLRYFPRLLLFEDAHMNDQNKLSNAVNPESTLVEKLILALQLSAGLDRIVDGPSSIDRIREVLEGAIVSGEKVDFTKLIATQNSQKRVPTNLEICSGGGDWATSQAVEGKKECYWITLEIRRDRVQQTFSTMLLKGVENMCVVGGDADDVLRRRFMGQSIDNIFINHPEPPERNSGTTGSDGAHLLTAEFFKVMLRVLRPRGRITIVTDNLPYGKSLIGIAASLKGSPSVLSSAPTLSTAVDTSGNHFGQDVVASVGDVCLFEGVPGAVHGYVTGTTSYFDRLWHRGKKNRRFFLSLTREELS